LISLRKFGFDVLGENFSPINKEMDFIIFKQGVQQIKDIRCGPFVRLYG